MGPANNAICRQCGQRAPIRLSGVEAFCTVCGARRTPFTALTSRTLNLAGKPSRWGGRAAKVMGTIIMVLGLTFTVSIGLIVNALASIGFAIGVALPFLVLTLLFGGGLLFGGRKLTKQGDQSERQAQLETIYALAAHRRGQLTAYDVAVALQLPEAKADDMLTEMAKQPDSQVALDLDADGRIVYLFGATESDRWRMAMPARIDAGAPAGRVPWPTPQADEQLDQAEAEAQLAQAQAARMRQR